ncbi:MAG: HAMP domain-containing histidine kinase [Selenomonadaceae bacterium]|nr:HAMP domain-containing histidine kinase [Selenomonadaceae bacterium]
MRLQDISIKRRIMLANFAMVLVPLCLLIPIVGLLLNGLHHSSAARLTELTWLWPEKGPMLTVQYLISELRVKVEKDKKLKSILKTCRLLEAQGIAVVIRRRDEILYATEGISALGLERQVARLAGRSQVMELWNDDGFIFRCVSRRSGLSVSAFGSVPFMVQGEISEGLAKGIIETILMAVVALEIVVVIVLGRYLSQLLSRQILKYEEGRKELIAGISHDLATPLTALKGYISGLRDGIVRTEEKRQQYIARMYETTESMERLVESLFMFSKLDLGRVEFLVERVMLGEYFEDFVSDRAPTLLTRGLTLRLTSDGSNCAVEIDRMQFGRVIGNLLENSLKYKRGDAVTVELDVRRSGDEVRIAFSDDGMGVEADQLPRLFESFYRTDAARSNVSKGSGLGLAVVKRIVEAMNGRVWAEASALGGLSIVMTFPLSKEAGE